MAYVMEQKQFLSNLKKKIFILEWKTTLILKQTLPNLVNFFKNYLGPIWYEMWLSTWLEVSMATTFW